MHDQIAELRALLTERQRYLAQDKPDRAGQVEDELERVVEALKVRLERLDATAAAHTAAGADVQAAEARVEARRITAAVKDALVTAGELDPDRDVAEVLRPDTEEPAPVTDGDAPAETTEAEQPPASTTAAETKPRERAVTPRAAAKK